MTAGGGKLIATAQDGYRDVIGLLQMPWGCQGA